MYRHIYILIFACLGFLLMPTQTYACSMEGMKKEKTNSHHTFASKNDDCKDKCSHQNNKKNHCGNDCNNMLCKCPTNCNTTFFHSNSFTFIKSVQPIIETSFSNEESSVSKGFYSIWLIPKIG